MLTYWLILFNSDVSILFNPTQASCPFHKGGVNMHFKTNRKGRRVEGTIIWKHQNWYPQNTVSSGDYGIECIWALWVVHNIYHVDWDPYIISNFFGDDQLGDEGVKFWPTPFTMIVVLKKLCHSIMTKCNFKRILVCWILFLLQAKLDLAAVMRHTGSPKSHQRRFINNLCYTACYVTLKTCHMSLVAESMSSIKIFHARFSGA